ncbi:MAG TPA: M1 family metallopeptidase [Vicinamibacterales bacterium]|nr:M1 family metallopeptidase [Vicinamibacterales bacterium]
MRRALFAVVLATATASAQTAPRPDGSIAPPLSPRNASYTIDARLDPPAHAIAGTETIAWRNITRTTATELQFHLYWNAWKDDRSTFMREAALAGRRSGAPDADRSRIDVTSIRLNGADVTASQHFIAPDDGNDGDRTVMAVPLPQPIGPGGSAMIQVDWTAHVPRTFDRTGVIGNFYFIAQWFPKLGVLQDEGWNCHQFHASTEFFSDYGTYDVSLTVPSGWPVGATGVERDHRDAGAGTTHHFYQDDVHDFAWTTSPDFVERVAQFTHPSLPPVTMRLLLQPEHLGQADRHFDATRTALKYYGEWYGAYPYGHITIVDPAFQSGSGGMEYPTLFTSGTRWLAPRLVSRPEAVTVHEAGHQFWYGIVGNNEFEDAWMDEGLNQFSTARALAAASTPDFLEQRYFGGFVPYVFRDMPLSREVDENGLASYRFVAKRDAQSTPSFRYDPSSTGGITYSKTALWLNTMERWLGWPALQRILAAHFSKWKFRHPTPSDFFETANAESGRDLTPFFDQVYRSANVFDYGVQDLRNSPISPASIDGGQTRTTVVVRRYGEAIFPVDVATTFAGGERVVEHWDGRDRWKLYTYERPARAVSAEVDPDRVLLLDVNWTNNSRTTEPQGGRAATKWSLKWMVWLQDCLLSWAALV